MMKIMESAAEWIVESLRPRALNPHTSVTLGFSPTPTLDPKPSPARAARTYLSFPSKLRAFRCLILMTATVLFVQLLSWTN